MTAIGTKFLLLSMISSSLGPTILIVPVVGVNRIPLSLDEAISCLLPTTKISGEAGRKLHVPDQQAGGGNEEMWRRARTGSQEPQVQERYMRGYARVRAQVGESEKKV